MKLTVEDSPIKLKKDATISIERNSPLLNEAPGSFSIPFAIPRRPNEQALGWPGRLQRTGDIAVQDFILESQGFQMLKGQVDYEPVSDDDIGMVLKSGYVEFRGKMDGKKLSEVSFGYEYGLPDTSDQNDVTGKLMVWDDANAACNDIYVASPCYCKGTEDDSVPVLINKVSKVTGMLTFSTLMNPNARLHMLQFYAYFILEKIFESAGYTVLQDDIKTGEFKNYWIASKIIRIRKLGASNYFIEGMKTAPNLYYSKLMPDVTVLEFVDRVLGHLCMYADIDERNKTVKILRKDTVLQVANKDKTAITELKGWEHDEESLDSGFTIGYIDQDNELDTEDDYEIDATIETLIFPTPDDEGKVIHMELLGKDYITVLEGETYSWKEIGRLKQYSDGNASETVEFNIKVATEIEDADETPLPLVIMEQNKISLVFAVPDFIAVSIYRGLITINEVGIPVSSSDALYLTTGGVLFQFDAACLSPEYLHTQQFADFLEWKVFNARHFVKYAWMTIQQLIALKWYKTYTLNGIEIILNQLNYDLPFKGVVKIDGYTARIEP